MPLTINVPITLDDATLAALRAALGTPGPVVTPPPPVIPPPPVVEAFDEGWYLLQNPDVKAAIPQYFSSGWDHYDKCGRAEGRQPAPTVTPGPPPIPVPLPELEPTTWSPLSQYANAAALQAACRAHPGFENGIYLDDKNAFPDGKDRFGPFIHFYSWPDGTVRQGTAPTGAVTPPPVVPPPVLPPPVVGGYANTRTITIPWGDVQRRYSKDVGGLRDNDLLVVRFTVPADAPVGKLCTISGAEWIDNGTPRDCCLSLVAGDFSGTSLGQGSMSEGTSFGLSFMVGPRKPGGTIMKPTYPGILPGQTAYLNVRSRGGGDGSTPCNVFVSLK
jgi:hypothetical protein